MFDFLMEYVLPIFLIIVIVFVSILIIYITPKIIDDMTNRNDCVLVEKVEK